jgi:hypothetical protein
MTSSVSLPSTYPSSVQATSLPSNTADSPLMYMQSPFGSFFAHANQGEILAITLALIFCTWLLYTWIVTYHWLRYGHKSWITVPALTTHVIVSGILFLIALAGFVGL